MLDFRSLGSKFLAVALCLVPGALGLITASNDFAAKIETATIEVRFDVRGAKDPRPNTLFVAVDRTSSDSYFPRWRAQGLQFPPTLSRAVWGRVINRLGKAGARAVVLAFYFGTIDPDGSPEDGVLVDAIRSSPVPVVVGIDCDTRTATGGSKGEPSARRELLRARARIGSICLYSDESLRQTPLRVFGRETGPQDGDFGLAASLSEALGRPIPEGAFRIPEDAADTEREEFAWIDFTRSPDALDPVSLFNIDRTLSMRELTKVAKGRVVVIGDTDYDPFYPTLPTFAAGDGRLFDGEVHALAVSTMLAEFPIRESPPWLEFLVFLALGVALPATSLVFGPRQWGLLAVALLAVVLAGSQLAFNAGLILPLVACLVTLLAGVLCAFIISVARSRTELKALRTRFAETDADAVAAVLQGTVRSGRPTTELIVPGYRVEAMVGRGASGNVYRATRLSTGEIVALKVVRPLLAEDETVRQQFEREFQAAKLLDHPNIVRLIEEGKVEIMYSASEYMPLGDLQVLLDKAGSLDIGQVLEVGDDIATALEAAHDVGLIHRDLKPSNIFRTDTAYKLGDFGIARLSGESTSPGAGGGVTGTIAYAAPEQLGGRVEQISPRTDVYGLAATLFALLTGRPPFARNSVEESIAAQARGEVGPLPAELSVLDPVFEAALQSNPAARPATPSALMGAIRAALENP